VPLGSIQSGEHEAPATPSWTMSGLRGSLRMFALNVSRANRPYNHEHGEEAEAPRPCLSNRADHMRYMCAVNVHSPVDGW
jgi:hypothetical protein